MRCMVWDASGSVSSVYTARCTNLQTPKGPLTQQTWILDRCKTHDMGGAGLAPQRGTPARARLSWLGLWAKPVLHPTLGDHQPWKSNEQKEIADSLLISLFKWSKVFLHPWQFCPVTECWEGVSGLQVGRSARGRQTDTRRSLLHFRKGKTPHGQQWDRTLWEGRISLKVI